MVGEINAGQANSEQKRVIQEVIMIVAKVHDEDKDKPCCECGLTLDRLRNMNINEMYYLNIGNNKMFICEDCLRFTADRLQEELQN